MSSDIFSFLGKSNDDDYYKLLGCGEHATTEQINTEFKKKAKTCHPDKTRHCENKDNHDVYFARLKRAREVLCDEKMRARYDVWRHIQVAVPFDVWMSLDKAAHSSVHWAAKPRSELMINHTDEEVSCETPMHGEKRKCPDEKNNMSDVSCAYNINTSEGQYVRLRWGTRNRSGHISKFRKYEI